MTTGLGQRTMNSAGAGAPLKVDIVVHGRFHGFALAQALLALGHDVLVHTNYPRYVVARFGVPRASTRSFLLHGLLARAFTQAEHLVSKDFLDRVIHPMFGRWAARGLRDDADIVYGFSGVMEEVLRLPRRNPSQLRLVCRGSAHIREQDRILEDEERRADTKIDRPSQWMIKREESEYASADMISVLSTFAALSFVERGLPHDRINMMPLGVNIAQFRPHPDAIAARQRRILSGEPLRVLSVGTFSFQKGTIDLIQVAAELSSLMQFRFVGSLVQETAHLMADATKHIQFVDRVAERALPAQYAWADVFLFPTLHDGFAAVLLQAASSGLVVISTTNCSASDFVDQGKTGFILPIRNAKSAIVKLRALDADRTALAAAAVAASASVKYRPWSEMASDLVGLTRSRQTGC